MQNIQKPQLWLIGGGETFDSREAQLEFLRNYPYEIGGKYYDWKSWIASGVSDTHDIVKPDFPCKQYADYDAWKIWFEKYIEKYIQRETSKKTEKTVTQSEAGDFWVTIIAHSLGGIFIAKYLSENIFPIKIHSLHMVAPVFGNEGLVGETIGNFVFDPESRNLGKQVERLHFWHSKDDPIVPCAHSESFHEYLPNSTLHTFEDRGHFANQAHFVELFLELIK